MQVDYYFTPASPWAYLGHARFVSLLQASGATVSVRPVDYGVVFPASGGLPLAKRAPQRQAYRLVELARFSQHLGVPLNPQPVHFPVPVDASSRLVLAARALAGDAAALGLAGRLGRAVWAENRSIADQATLAAIVREAGLPATVATRAASPEAAADWATATQQALDAGVFGAPTYVVDGELFWGQDRLDFLARRLGVA